MDPIDRIARLVMPDAADDLGTNHFRRMLPPDALIIPAGALLENARIDRLAVLADFHLLRLRALLVLDSVREHLGYLELEAEALARHPTRSGAIIRPYCADLSNIIHACEQSILPASSAIASRAEGVLR